MKHSFKQIQYGFTLLELVVVIAVVGVLLVVATPKLIGTSGDARLAALNGVGSALSSASAFNYGKRSAAVDSSSNNSVRNCTDASNSLNSNGLPAAYTITTAAIAVGATAPCVLSTVMTPVLTTTFTVYGID